MRLHRPRATRLPRHLAAIPPDAGGRIPGEFYRCWAQQRQAPGGRVVLQLWPARTFGRRVSPVRLLALSAHQPPRGSLRGAAYNASRGRGDNAVEPAGGGESGREGGKVEVEAGSVQHLSKFAA